MPTKNTESTENTETTNNLKIPENQEITEEADKTVKSAVVRKIIHIDMDAFYASVEMRDNPALLGLPVVVGGDPNSRGVVAAASYEARKFGIRSAMPASRAYRLCPRAVFLKPNFAKYRQVSTQIHQVFYRYTELVEPLSLDEAYLDVTSNKMGNPSATWIAGEIRQAIKDETGLTASAGVAPNKFLAKIASDEKKPDGLFVIRPEEVRAFVATLPLQKVPGIGKATLKRFQEMGKATCGDLLEIPLAELTHRFGKRGAWFYQIARGEDQRPVEPERLTKSVSIEDTFAQDHEDPDWLQERLEELARGLSTRLKKQELKGRTLTLKLRLADFSTHTRSHTLPQFTDDARLMGKEAARLFDASGFAGRKFRLLGLGLSQLNNTPAQSTRQLTFPWGTPGAGEEG